MKPIILLLILSVAPVQGQGLEPDLPKGMIVVRLDHGRLQAKEVYLLAVTRTKIAYKMGAANVAPVVESMSEVDSIFLYEPKDYLEALDLFEGRKYAKAKGAFAQVKEKYGKAFPGLPDNPGVLAGFYELECLRKLNDLEGMRVALKGFKRDALTNRVALQQLELYELWDVIRSGRNKEALSLVAEYKGKQLPGYQRAQVAYCQARAMEELIYPDHDILLAYQTAITADFGADEIITRDAILRSLGIIHSHEQVQAAIRAFEMTNGREMLGGFNLAMEAAGLCAIYEKQSDAQEPLPAQYRYFLKYTADEVEQRRKAAGVIE